MGETPERKIVVVGPRSTRTSVAGLVLGIILATALLASGCGGPSAAQHVQQSLDDAKAESDAAGYVSTIAEYCASVNDPAAIPAEVAGMGLLANDASTKLVDVARAHPDSQAIRTSLTDAASAADGCDEHMASQLDRVRADLP